MTQPSLFNLVLDLDDTLFLEADYVKSGFLAIDRWLNSEHAIEDFFHIAWFLFCEGVSGHEVFDHTFAALNIPTQWLQQIVEVYRSHTPEICLLPDAKFLFKHYHKDCPLFLITDGRPQGQEAKIHALHIGHYFEKIYITGHWGEAYFKPHPRAFEEIMLLSNLPSIYIADNPKKDFIAPMHLNWLPSIRVKRPGSLHYNLPTPKGCYEVTDLCEAIALLEKGV